MPHIEVIRPFYLAGQVQATGSVIDVTPLQAAELVALNKARPASAPTPAAEKPAPAPRRGKQGAPHEPV